MAEKIKIEKRILTGLFRAFADNRPDRFIELGREVVKVFYDNFDEECAFFIMAQINQANSFETQENNAVERPKVIQGTRKDTAPYNKQFGKSEQFNN